MSSKIFKVSEKYKIDLNDPIGKGVFGEVYHCSPKTKTSDLPDKLAAKKLSITSDMDLNDLTEIEILAEISHPNIIKFYDVIITPTELFIILEYAENGDLSKYVLKYTGQVVSEKEAIVFLKQIASGLEHMYTNHKVIHRDLKPANILLGENNKVKIADFGFAKLVKETTRKRMTKAIGSVFYMAPEVFEGSNYDYKCDVWSVGIMMFELLYGYPPWITTLSDPEHFKFIHDHPEISFPKDKSVSKNFKDLIQKMLIVDPNERISWEDVLKHPALVENIQIEGKNYLKGIIYSIMIILSGSFEKFKALGVTFRRIYHILQYLHYLATTLVGQPSDLSKKISSLIEELISKNDTEEEPINPLKIENGVYELNRRFCRKFKKKCENFIKEATQERKDMSIRTMDDEVKKVLIWFIYLRKLERLDGKQEKQIKKEVEEMLMQRFQRLLSREGLKDFKNKMSLQASCSNT